ncbi:DUF952 domain-containing protein, partial [Streptomyces sp. SID14478]|uniref:DUF952 domain-containing protein n=1 Tax=Streptomyces sp. SID14478 TaxID=2706073 RepID=UPI0013DEE548
DARRAARTDAAGELVRLDEQDRTRWDHDAIAEGVALVERALSHGPVGPYQLQAAIAALHDEAARAEDTDWPQILALYDLLVEVAPAADPMAALGRAVAVAMVHGPAAGLAETDKLTGALGGHHRLAAVRAHLLELAGDRDAARAAYQEAAAGTLSRPEQRYLRVRAARLTPWHGNSPPGTGTPPDAGTPPWRGNSPPHKGDSPPDTEDTQDPSYIGRMSIELLHLTERALWQSALVSGTYTMSTRGKSLQEVGFIHCSYPHQVRAVAELLYGTDPAPGELVVLVIDPERLDVPVRVEPGVPGGEQFPHIYGPLPLSAVTEVRAWEAGE